MEYFESHPSFWQIVINFLVLLDSRYVRLVVFLWREPLQNVTAAKLWKQQSFEKPSNSRWSDAEENEGLGGGSEEHDVN